MLHVLWSFAKGFDLRGKGLKLTQKQISDPRIVEILYEAETSR
jgi:hypothetical protein